jgi:hypothetical protein
MKVFITLLLAALAALTVAACAGHGPSDTVYDRWHDASYRTGGSGGGGGGGGGGM